MERLDKRAGRRALLALAFVCLGCQTLGSYQTANTLGEGRYEVALEPAFQGVSSMASPAAAVGMPHLDLAGRFGVSDNIDLGLRVGTSLLQVGAKFQLTDRAEKSIVLSLAPEIGTSGVPAPFVSINMTLPLLIGIGVGEASQLVIGPKLHNVAVFAGRERFDLLMLGGTVGYSLALGDRVRLMPELAVLYPVVGGERLSRFLEAPRAFAFQAGVGILIGSGRRMP